uniref:MKRN2 opposite strand protein-like C-terminal domain-containing protein n=1 Tax=Plectus sambesii TaxID=2011161 RepID=A0A914VXK3_9BILA
MLCSLVHPCSARLILSAHYKDNNSPSQNCPKCNKPVKDEIPMELLPSPFVQMKDLSSSIIVKPSCGAFLNSYTLGDDLHIGIYSSSNGNVFSYWTKGIEVDDGGWDDSLVVYSFPDPNITDCHLSRFIDSKRENCWSIAMAEVLEALDNDSDEIEFDRRIDRASFVRQQFDIFKHNYRELAAEKAEEVLQAGFEQGFTQVRPIARRMARVRGALVALEEADNTPGSLYSDVTDVLKKLDAFTSDAATRSTEFSPSTAHLAPFDAHEMQMFLGADAPPSPANPTTSLLADSHTTAAACKDNVDLILLSADALHDRFSNLLHTRGLCNAFIYD